jgi:DNA-directed RNA polymerase sigma subunit (sigma70/sigma32)
VQAGRIGLWRAIEGYDARRGTAFSTYAWVAICRHPDGELERKLIQEALLDLVSQLPERLGQVIMGRYGLGEHPPCTLKKLGKELGVTGERVRQLQQDALTWLRYPVHSWRLRQLVGKNTVVDYRRALVQNAALRCSRRQKR